MTVSGPSTFTVDVDGRPPLFTRPFVLAAVANALLNFAAFLFVHLPGFLQQLGAGEAEIGRIMAGQAVGAIIAWPLVGRVVDRRGRRVVILAGVGLFVGVLGLYVAIDGLGPYIYGVRLLDGVATAMFYTGLFTYAADLVPASRRTEGLAIFGVSGLLSLALGAQSGDLILAYATYRELFVAAFGLAALGLIACLSLRDVPAEHADRAVPPRHVLVTAAQRNLLSVWIATFAFFVGVLAVFSFMKTYVAATGFSDVGSFFTAYAGVAVALRIFLAWLPERLGERRVLGIAMASYAVGFVVLAMAHGGEYVLAAAFVCGAGHGYAYPVLFSLVVARARPQERGAAAAFFTMLDWLALLVAAPVVGYLIERTGYGATFMTLALLLAMGIAMFYSLDRRGVAA